METKDILQVDATLIAGAFIFLSLSITFPNEFDSLDNTSKSNTTANKTTNDTSPAPMEETISSNILAALVALVAIIFFAMSAFIAILSEWDKSNPVIYEKNRKGSLMLMVIGFLALIAISLALVVSLVLAS
ncbi:MAG TPA: hypothetical protein VKA09_01365 [Nitrososphaeraceae archaeon]|nr:hypothetical protein [Nitrososphaeraceae archaeon]